MPRRKKETAFGMSEDAARKLTQDNIERTIRQCEAENKPLPASIAKIVAQIAAGVEKPSQTNIAPNKRALAKAIGITPPTLYRLLKKPNNPGVSSNGGYDITMWRQFYIAKGDAKVEGGEVVPLSLKEKSQIDKNSVATRRELFKLEVEMRDYVPRKEVNEAIDSANTVVQRELRKQFEHVLPPQLDGQSAHEIQRMNRAALDDIFISLPKHLEGLLPEA